jgi:hypothetical protein
MAEAWLFSLDTNGGLISAESAPGSREAKIIAKAKRALRADAALLPWEAALLFPDANSPCTKDSSDGRQNPCDRDWL